MSRPLSIRALATIVAISLVICAIPKARAWLTQRIKTFDYLWDYFVAFYRNFIDVVWGVAVVSIVLGVPFLVWSLVTQFVSIPVWLNWTAILLAWLITGYYVWRVDHLRLIPNFEITAYTVQLTDTFDKQSGLKNGWSSYFQLLPRCLTDANVEDCRGLLTSVEMYDGFKHSWETVESETMFLQWSHGDESTEPESIILYSGAERRLNVFCLPNDNPEIRMCVFPYPVRFFTLFNRLGLRQIREIRFNIRVVAKNCPPVDVVMTITLTNDTRRPNVNLEQTGHPKRSALGAPRTQIGRG